MFRRRQKLVLAPSSEIFDVMQVTNNDGQIETVVTSASAELPDPKLFDLKSQLDAGIEQEEVKAAVLSPSTVNADNIVRKYTKKSQVKNEGE